MHLALGPSEIEPLRREIRMKPAYRSKSGRLLPPAMIAQRLNQRPLIPNPQSPRKHRRNYTVEDLALAIEKSPTVAALAAAGWITPEEGLQLAGISLETPDPDYRPEIEGPSPAQQITGRPELVLSPQQVQEILTR